MDNKNLRKISRKELLEILLSQAKRIDELEQELTKTKNKLASKKIAIDESGSLAEAVLKLNNIFDKAQETADQYMYNIKEKCKKMQNDIKKESQTEKEKLIKETNVIWIYVKFLDTFFYTFRSSYLNLFQFLYW